MLKVALISTSKTLCNILPAYDLGVFADLTGSCVRLFDFFPFQLCVRSVNMSQCGMPVVPLRHSASGLEFARVRSLSHRGCILKVSLALPPRAYGDLCDSNVEQKRSLSTAGIVTTSATAPCDVRTKKHAGGKVT